MEWIDNNFLQNFAFMWMDMISLTQVTTFFALILGELICTMQDRLITVCTAKVKT